MGYGLRITGYGTCIGWSVQTEHASGFSIIFCCIVCHYCGNGLVFVPVFVRSHAKHTIRYPVSFSTCQKSYESSSFYRYMSLLSKKSTVSLKQPFSVLHILSAL
jgi:hypothetical protein